MLACHPCFPSSGGKRRTERGRSSYCYYTAIIVAAAVATAVSVRVVVRLAIGGEGEGEGWVK